MWYNNKTIKIDYCLQLIKITMNDCDSFLTTLSDK